MIVAEATSTSAIGTPSLAVAGARLPIIVAATATYQAGSPEAAATSPAESRHDAPRSSSSAAFSRVRL